ncbi:MAG: hypothetical protein AB7V56_12700 [Candidatus Nitrosocosmicus sp.]
MSKQLQIKERIKEQYGKFALSGDSDSCCSPTKNCCGTKDNNNGSSSVFGIDISKTVGYDPNKLDSIPRSSVLGLGCGNPTAFAHIKNR